MYEASNKLLVKYVTPCVQKSMLPDYYVKPKTSRLNDNNESQNISNTSLQKLYQDYIKQMQSS